MNTGPGPAIELPSTSYPSPWLPLKRGVTVSAGIVLVSGLLILGPWLSQADKSPLSDALSVLTQVVAAGWGMRRVRAAPSGPFRRAWLFITLNQATWAVANCVFLYYNNLSASQPFPSIADALYVVGIIPALVGLMWFPVGRAVGGYGWRLFLDGAVLGSALLLASYLLFLKDTFQSLGSGWSAAVLAFYPLSDLAAVILVGLLILRSAGGGRRVDLPLLALGFLGFAIADVVYGVVAADGYYTANLLDLGYIVAPLLVGLSALCPAPSPCTARDTGAEPERIVSALPDLAVLVAVSASPTLGFHDWHDWVLTVVAMALSAVRQLVLAFDNRALRRGLQMRVDVRTVELDRLARRYEGLLASVGDGIYGVDLDGRVSFLNPAAARFLGREHSELIGRHACATFHAPASEEDTGCVLDLVLSTGHAMTTAGHEHVRLNGAPFPVELTAAPINDGDRPTGAVVVFRDISERQAMDRMKSEFISVVSHELRTPLTSIRGGLEMLADGDLGHLPGAAKRVVDIALNGSERLTRLIGDILDVERLESGTLPFHFVMQPTEPLVRAAVDSVRPLADEAGVQLIVGEVEGQLRADGDRLVQALTNLVGNAVKFTPSGGRVVMSVESREEGVTFAVADDGRGIPADHLDSIFERFQQVATSDTRDLGGTGLGLPITKSIIERHGGRIWVDSEMGVGSTFSFSVPAPRGHEVHQPSTSTNGTRQLHTVEELAEQQPVGSHQE